jgi:hypothetical protein
MAAPPIQVWMPNQPQATMARRNAGMCAPLTPNEARANTGNGMPYLVPACPDSAIGTSTITLPSSTVSMACCQLMPPSTSVAAIMYEGMLMAMPTHRAKKETAFQSRRAGGTGARSALLRVGSEPFSKFAVVLICACFPGKGL